MQRVWATMLDNASKMEAYCLTHDSSLGTHSLGHARAVACRATCRPTSLTSSQEQGLPHPPQDGKAEGKEKEHERRV